MYGSSTNQIQLKGKDWELKTDEAIKGKKGVTLRAPSNTTIAAIVQIHPIGDGGKFVIGNTEPPHGTIGFNTSEDTGHLTLWMWEHKYDFYVIGEVTLGWLITT